MFVLLGEFLLSLPPEQKSSLSLARHLISMILLMKNQACPSWMAPLRPMVSVSSRVRACRARRALPLLIR